MLPLQFIPRELLIMQLLCIIESMVQLFEFCPRANDPSSCDTNTFFGDVFGFSGNHFSLQMPDKIDSCSQFIKGVECLKDSLCNFD